MEAGCRECTADGGLGIEHCHGTLIVHTLWRSECTDDQCTTPELFTHTFVIDCDAVGCECVQPIGSAEVFAS